MKTLLNSALLVGVIVLPPVTTYDFGSSAAPYRILESETYWPDGKIDSHWKTSDKNNVEYLNRMAYSITNHDGVRTWTDLDHMGTIEVSPMYKSTTNMLIHWGYEGTIQVGTNYYRLSNETNNEDNVKLQIIKL